MHPQALQVVLRPRRPWEAVELGCALVRRHARAIWWPWLLLSLPVFVLVNGLFWWLDQLWLAGLVLWWWLPVFDRIPLYVLSRAVFGQTPGMVQTLRALPDWRRGRLVAHLLWRRLSPWRALGLPVDLLEDGTPAAKRARRWVILQGQAGYAVLLAWMSLGSVLMLTLALVALLLLFVPGEQLTQWVRLLWIFFVTEPPQWAQVTLNALLWLAFSVIEPFHVGAGFGLYLNRRVHLEGWDIEITLRRLRTRLGIGSGAALVAACLLLPGWTAAMPSLAENHDVSQVENAQEDGYQALREIFGAEQVAEPGAFIHAVETAKQDPLLHPQQTRQIWIRDPSPTPAKKSPDWNWKWGHLRDWLAVLGELLLWLLLVALVVFLGMTAPRWWPWMRGHVRLRRRDPAPVSTAVLPGGPSLPAHPVARARALWQAGERRQALAVLYRSSLAVLAACPDLHLSTGATEAECLRLSRHLPLSGQQVVFAKMVQVWQAAAYARRWPDDTQFESLGGELAECFGWPK